MLDSNIQLLAWLHGKHISFFCLFLMSFLNNLQYSVCQREREGSK